MTPNDHLRARYAVLYTSRGLSDRYLLKALDAAIVLRRYGEHGEAAAQDMERKVAERLDAAEREPARLVAVN